MYECTKQKHIDIATDTNFRVFDPGDSGNPHPHGKMSVHLASTCGERAAKEVPGVREGPYPHLHFQEGSYPLQSVQIRTHSSRVLRAKRWAFTMGIFTIQTAGGDSAQGYKGIDSGASDLFTCTEQYCMSPWKGQHSSSAAPACGIHPGRSETLCRLSYNGYASGVQLEQADRTWALFAVNPCSFGCAPLWEWALPNTLGSPTTWAATAVSPLNPCSCGCETYLWGLCTVGCAECLGVSLFGGGVIRALHEQQLAQCHSVSLGMLARGNLRQAARYTTDASVAVRAAATTRRAATAAAAAGRREGIRSHTHADGPPTQTQRTTGVQLYQRFVHGV
eukprot:gene15915-biopygen5226